MPESYKVETILKEREVAFYHPAISRQHLNFSTAHPKNSNVDGILLGDKNAASLCSKTISTLLKYI